MAPNLYQDFTGWLCGGGTRQGRRLRPNKLSIYARISSIIDVVDEKKDVDMGNTPVEDKGQATSRAEAWLRLRGCMKEIFAEFGGGEAYLRAERANFFKSDISSEE